jgi:hypothetical protein
MSVEGEWERDGECPINVMDSGTRHRHNPLRSRRGYRPCCQSPAGDLTPVAVRFFVRDGGGEAFLASAPHLAAVVGFSPEKGGRTAKLLGISPPRMRNITCNVGHISLWAKSEHQIQDNLALALFVDCAMAFS